MPSIKKTQSTPAKPATTSTSSTKQTAKTSSNMPPAPAPRDTWVTGHDGRSVFVPASEQPGGSTKVTTPTPGPTVNAKGTLDFRSGWSQQASGDLVAGGKMTINYDISRLSSLRNTHNGFPAWGVTAYVMFEPSGKISEGQVMQFKSDMGRPTNEPQNAPLTLDIPAGTTGVQVWFKNWTGADSPREAYDSNFGKNYRFDVKQP